MNFQFDHIAQQICTSVPHALRFSLLLASMIALQTAVVAQTETATLDDLPDELQAIFNSADGDGDQQVSLGGLLRSLPQQDAARTTRDFLVLDFNRDEQLDLNEFLCHPLVAPIDHRGHVPDPFRDLFNTHWTAIASRWNQADVDQNGTMSSEEFQTVQLHQTVPGLESTHFSDWDLDNDNALSQSDARLVLEVAFGLSQADGVSLRTSSGRVSAFAHFGNCDTDKNGTLSRDEFINGNGGDAATAERFQRTDSDQDGLVSLDEWNRDAAHDLVQAFLLHDTNLDAAVSLAEIQAATPDWALQMTTSSFSGFDSDKNGTLSLYEYMLLPQYNLVVAWHFLREDVNADGTLSFDEFSWGPGVPFAALRAVYFHKVDHNADGVLDFSEWSFNSKNPEVSFARADVDQNQHLSFSEFKTVSQLEAGKDLRDFRVFDANHDEQLSLNEFRTAPYLVPFERRGTLSDPVIEMVDAAQQKCEAGWKSWDTDNNGSISRVEFSKSELAKVCPGLTVSLFAHWDRNGDEQIDLEECRRLLEIAYGVRRAEGDLLRLPSGYLVQYAHFHNCDSDRNGRLSALEFIAGNGNNAHARAEMKRMDNNADGSIHLSEWTVHTSLDFMNSFLAHDQDLNGRVSMVELTRNSPDWARLLNDRTFPRFDDDHDGELSLMEFMFLPQMNLVVPWHLRRTDQNGDGVLSLSEFEWEPGVAMSALRHEYFRRLDVDGNGTLDQSEWAFNFDPVRSPRKLVFKQLDSNSDGQLSLDEVLPEHLRSVDGAARLEAQAHLAQIEEAFRRADQQGDGALQFADFDSDAGLETIAPGSTGLASGAPAGLAVGSASLSNADLRWYAIIGFNVVLLLGVAMLLLSKGNTT